MPERITCQNQGCESKSFAVFKFYSDREIACDDCGTVLTDEAIQRNKIQDASDSE